MRQSEYSTRPETSSPGAEGDGELFGVPASTWTTLFPDAPHATARTQASNRATVIRPASRIQIDPDNARNGLMQLVLTLVELIRELLERQAIRRIDAGSLTDAEIERLGQTFLRLSQEMERLKQQCGFSDEDLNLDLGPLGRLRN